MPLSASLLQQNESLNKMRKYATCKNIDTQKTLFSPKEFKHKFFSIALFWRDSDTFKKCNYCKFCIVSVMAPIFAHSKIRRYELHDKLLSLQCKEDFPSPEWNYAFTGIFLFVQYILPLIIIPFVHSKIVIFLRYVSNWNFSCYI